MALGNAETVSVAWSRSLLVVVSGIVSLMSVMIVFPVAATSDGGTGCSRRGLFLVECRWTDLLSNYTSLPANGAEFTVYPRFFDVLRIVINCNRMYTQSVHEVDKAGYESCNATMHASGQRHVLKATNLDADEHTIYACYKEISGSMFWSYRYARMSQEVHYFIGTVQDPDTQDPFAVDNLVGGQCLLGLKAKLTINWPGMVKKVPAPVTTSPSMIPATNANNETLLNASSNLSVLNTSSIGNDSLTNMTVSPDATDLDDYVLLQNDTSIYYNISSDEPVAAGRSAAQSIHTSSHSMIATGAFLLAVISMI
eukprot:scpid90899/ scgid24266/ 